MVYLSPKAAFTTSSTVALLLTVTLTLSIHFSRLSSARVWGPLLSSCTLSPSREKVTVMSAPTGSSTVTVMVVLAAP